jgi:winged helix-turn helix protein
VAFREVTVLEVREVLRLSRDGLAKKRIARRLGLDIKTVRRYLELAEESGISPAGTSTRRWQRWSSGWGRAVAARLRLSRHCSITQHVHRGSLAPRDGLAHPRSPAALAHHRDTPKPMAAALVARGAAVELSTARGILSWGWMRPLNW